MLFGGLAGELEVRARKGGGATIAGSFPYGPKYKAVLSDGGRNGGRPKKEYFKNHAFRFSVESSELDIHFLWGHNFGHPLASRSAKSLTLKDTFAALLFEAQLSEEVLETTHGRDFMSLLSAGLVGGVSPGFRLPPPSAVPEPEVIFEEPEEEGRAIVREVSEALLFELSAVTRPAYDQTAIEARCWDPSGPIITPNNARYRWR